MNRMYTPLTIYKYRDHQFAEVDDNIAAEFPLTIFVNDQELVTLVCSPQDFSELAVGFLLSEGLISDSSDISALDFQEEGLIHIKITKDLSSTNNFLRRNIASCCGKGRAGLYFVNDARQVQAVESNLRIKVSLCIKHMKILEEKSQTFYLTGGVHSAALVQEDNFLFYFEDIGRHNAIDKALGSMILQKLSSEDKSLFLSGRISSEIVIKAARANIPIIVSKAAPTDLAVLLAEDLNITVIGFVREERFNVYSGIERLIIDREINH